MDQQLYERHKRIEMGMTRATRDANQREKQKHGRGIKDSRSGICRPIPVTGQSNSGQIGLVEGLYQVLAPGPAIIKVSPTMSTIKRTRQSNRDCE